MSESPVLRLYGPDEVAALPAPDVMLSMLDDVERGRAWRLPDATNRVGFIAGRYALRLLAAEASGTEPALLRTAFHCPQCAPAAAPPDHGQPGYSLDGILLPLALSLSRAAGYVLLAALPQPEGARIGVDVESTNAVDFKGFDDVALSAEESKAVGALPPKQQVVARARLWARKEALLKALGSGLRRDPAGLTLLRDRRVSDVLKAGDAVVPSELVAAVAVVRP